MREFEVRALTGDDLPAVRALWSTIEGLGHGPRRNAEARDFWASVGGEPRRELGLWSIDLSP